MHKALLAALALVLATTSTALAAPRTDLSVTITPPGSVYVEDVGHYTVTVANVSNKDAADVRVTILLPATHTSPQVFVLGTVVSWSAGCSLSGTTLSCNLGTIRRSQSRAVSVDIALPQSSAPLTFVATATSATAEATPANNTASVSASLLYRTLAVGPPRDAHVRHCTGQGLTAFFECTLFPGALSSHDLVLNAGGSISFPAQAPTSGGTWSQPTPTSLVMTYTDNTLPVATFIGYGVDGNCFEGLTTFPGSPWVAPYEVCLQ